MNYLLAVAWAVRTRAPARRKKTRKNAADTVGRKAQGQVQSSRPSSLASDKRLVGIMEWKRYSTRKEGHSSIVILKPPQEGWEARVVRDCPIPSSQGVG
jgi:hypothetical protein